MTTSSAATPNETWRFCVLTATGRGAIASIGLSGPASLVALNRLFTPASGRSLASYEVGSTVYGQLRSSAEASEGIVVGIFGNDKAEIHCHGGQAAVAAICD